MGHWRAALGFIALFAVLLALLLPWPAHNPAVQIAQAAQSAPQPLSDTFHDIIRIEGKEVPLPVGNWLLAGRAISGNNPLKVLSVALLRLNGEAVDAAILIQTNRLDADALWGKAAACDRTDLYYAHVRYSSDHDGSCAYAAYVDGSVPRDATDPAWQAALLHGLGKGWQFPHYWMEAAYRITDPRDAIQVRYLFAAPDHTNGKAVKSLVSWTQASWYDVGTGFRNRLDEGDVLPDWRHPDLKDATQLPSVVGVSEKEEVEHLSVKATTYRIFATITDMSVNYIWLGSLPSAGGLAIVGATASSVLYFFHELIWSHFEQPPLVIGNLPGVGVEGPGPRV